MILGAAATGGRRRAAGGGDSAVTVAFPARSAVKLSRRRRLSPKSSLPTVFRRLSVSLGIAAVASPPWRRRRGVAVASSS